MNRLKKWCCLSLVIAMPLIMPVTAVNADASQLEQTQYSEGQLAQMLAPIALYPDSLLTHILIAATYPLEVVQAHRWQQSKQHLSTQKQIDKAQDKDWDPSVVALIAFPNVLQKLSEDLDWTQSLGDAFLQDETQVLASIQTLRQEADNANSLEQMENMQVTRVSNQIIIEPVRKEIVYVPYYDPRTVYGYWRWYRYPPVYWAVYPGYVRPSYGHFYWRAGVHISFNYYFSAFHWHKRHVVVVHHHNSHRYRHRGRIVTSHGAKRWAHKPQHRRGVAYSSGALRHKYNRHQPKYTRSKVVGPNTSKQRAYTREQTIRNKLKPNASAYSKPTHSKAHNQLKTRSAKPAKYSHNKQVQPSYNKQAHNVSKAYRSPAAKPKQIQSRPQQHRVRQSVNRQAPAKRGHQQAKYRKD
ncbi:hypothetical protein TUM4438_25090 [Shewanella sairae]|uniref:DUF3300 domain-containing protein n=1 Tax=Shewanella sairae TaxID=190310 RepID=A0ABQ4PHR5_9GAMM|nr:DUF3300 domain-containing protein [Shewanella sairae]MCL1131344.1 DUF3300 domain-containing protein [Shewanella sairae]GIU47100.1 hypothetical protein TUM4438_25090 [Shewanella sairae]